MSSSENQDPAEDSPLVNVEEPLRDVEKVESVILTEKNSNTIIESNEVHVENEEEMVENVTDENVETEHLEIPVDEENKNETPTVSTEDENVVQTDENIGTEPAIISQDSGNNYAPIQENLDEDEDMVVLSIQNDDIGADITNVLKSDDEETPTIIEGDQTDVADETEPQIEQQKFTEYQEIDTIQAIKEGVENPKVSMDGESQFGVAFDDLMEKTSLEKLEERQAQLRSLSEADEFPRRKSQRKSQASVDLFGLADGKMAESTVQTYMEEEDEEDGTEVEEILEEVPKIDREPYYERYAVIEKDLNEIQLKNTYLQKKMGEYFKKRRMMHVFKESQILSDTQHKYELKLDALNELHKITTLETTRVTEELLEMKEKRDDKFKELTCLFQDFQKRENEIGKDLLLANITSNMTLEKIIERLLKKQKSQMSSVINMRLDYIMIRDKVAEKNAALRSLDDLGPNLHLIDYEQLKFDNRNHQDKLEERETDLIRLRFKCQNAMQMLAHKREKSAALDTDMEVLEDRFDDINMELNECRERLNFFKQERDSYRIQIANLKEESGLLTKTKLLNDMEASIEEIQVLSENHETLKRDCEVSSQQVKAVRQNLQMQKEKKPQFAKPLQMKPSKKRLPKRLPCSSKFH